MFDPLRFRRDLAARVLGAMGTVSLAAVAWSCTSSGGPAVSGTGGAATTSTTTTPAGNAAPMTRQCFEWSPDMGNCPSDATAVLARFKCCGCPTGWEPATIDSPPTATAGNQCCYMVTLELCAGAGRPYLVGEQARVAAVERASGARGWTLGASPIVEGLGVEERALLAKAWTADASLEHASVASFSRFALALLAAGAPADLVELTQRAALDEVRHAQLCFALASAYAGEDIAPGPFPLGGEVRVDASLVALAVTTVREGCVGETLAAVVAARQLAGATDPAVRAALAQIADDEAQHAELAWRTVAWAVEAGGREVRAAVAEALERALAGSRRAAPHGAGAAAPWPGGLLAHGRLDRATVAAVTASAMADIVAPAARTLFHLETVA